LKLLLMQTTSNYTSSPLCLQHHCINISIFAHKFDKHFTWPSLLRHHIVFVMWCHAETQWDLFLAPLHSWLFIMGHLWSETSSSSSLLDDVSRFVILDTSTIQIYYYTCGSQLVYAHSGNPMIIWHFIALVFSLVTTWLFTWLTVYPAS